MDQMKLVARLDNKFPSVSFLFQVYRQPSASVSSASLDSTSLFENIKKQHKTKQKRLLLLT